MTSCTYVFITKLILKYVLSTFHLYGVYWNQLLSHVEYLKLVVQILHTSNKSKMEPNLLNLVYIESFLPKRYCKLYMPQYVQNVNARGNHMVSTW